jgi:hypothetical protein
VRAAPVDVTDRLACRFWIQDKANRDSDFDSALQQKITSLVENRAKKKWPKKPPPRDDLRPTLDREELHTLKLSHPARSVLAWIAPHRSRSPSHSLAPGSGYAAGRVARCTMASVVPGTNHEAVGLRLARADIQSADPHTMACLSKLAIVQG